MPAPLQRPTLTQRVKCYERGGGAPALLEIPAAAALAEQLPTCCRQVSTLTKSWPISANMC